MHIAEIARALMYERNLPHYYWDEAIHTAIYIMNRTPQWLYKELRHRRIFVAENQICGI